MRELAKMATGLVAKSGFGPWLRAVLFAGMAIGVWQLWLFAARRTCGPSSDFIMPAVIGLGIVNFVALMGGGLAERGLRDTVRWLPLVMWAEMTDGGEDVRLWAIVVWPFLLPAELVICAGTAVAAAVCAVSRVLNVRLK